MKFKLPTRAKMWQEVAYLSVAIGVCLSIHGLWLFYKPLAYIVGGMLLAGAGFFSGLERRSDDGEGWE
jgi:hypothetical protein